MAINYSKLRKQIHPFKEEQKQGYIFIATDKQKDNWIFSCAVEGSKRRMIDYLTWLIMDDEDWQKEFLI